MRNEYIDGNQTARNNTDARVKPLAFNEQDLQRRIAIHELWGGDLMIPLTIYQM